MGQTAEDIEVGLVCMECQQFLIGDDGQVCNCNHPVHCRDCFMEKPMKQRLEIIQYFDPKSSKVVCYEGPKRPKRKGHRRDGKNE